jgi:DNA-binding NtrC family response regulator
VLQEKEIRRIGGKETIKLDVRIIAATNKNMAEEITRGKFREDLYYRLNVIAFTIRPLREKVTDIPLLVDHFLKKLNDTHGMRKSVTKEALQAFMSYSWPGNVRQLDSTMERAYIMSETDTIDAEHLPQEIVSERIGSATDYLIDARLTSEEYRLYLYLVKIDSLGDRHPELLQPKHIMERLEISKGTFYTAVARLKELGLYDFKAKAVQNKLFSSVRSPKEHLV